MGRLRPDPNFVCPRCLGSARAIDGRPFTQVDVDGAMLDVEDSFCYLGDMLDAGGGCDNAVATRCAVGWGKFRKLLPILTSRHLTPEETTTTTTRGWTGGAASLVTPSGGLTKDASPNRMGKMAMGLI